MDANRSQKTRLFLFFLSTDYADSHRLLRFNLREPASSADRLKLPDYFSHTQSEARRFRLLLLIVVSRMITRNFIEQSGLLSVP
ncbi:hypothetical protein, partial [Candidatus Thiosymbion oneisti]|uniref:hypothetical protein n=1 Tax=Candidatus Thiosymbion oneisti TaxID=589554 RepID=UPI001A9C7413